MMLKPHGHDRDTSLLRQIREAARTEYRIPIREELRAVGDRLAEAFTDFSKTCASEDLERLNSLWARGVYLVGIASAPADPESTGGKIAVAA